MSEHTEAINKVLAEADCLWGEQHTSVAGELKDWPEPIGPDHPLHKAIVHLENFYSEDPRASLPKVIHEAWVQLLLVSRRHSLGDGARVSDGEKWLLALEERLIAERDRVEGRPPSGETLTEPMTRERIGDLFIVHRNKVPEQVLSKYHHTVEPSGKIRMLVSNMPPSYKSELRSSKK